jgi:hypothetical protein
VLLEDVAEVPHRLVEVQAEAEADWLVAHRGTVMTVMPR